MLNAGHDRSAFSCGEDSLDEFLKKYATQNAKTGIAKTFVATRPPVPTAPPATRVIGYYSISSGHVEFDVIPDDLTRRLPHYPIPIVHLGRLAVDESMQGQGLGEHLLLDAMRRIVAASEVVGIHAIEVKALHDRAKSFYLKYGFCELRDDDLRLFIPLSTVRKLGLV